MRNRLVLSLLLILGLLNSVFALDAHAGGVVTITDRFGSTTDPGTLAWALNGGGTVTFDCDGTITVTPAIQINADTIIDATGRNIILSGNNTNSVFVVLAEKKLDLIGLTITGGAVYGGVRNVGGIVTINSCLISGNTSMYGGGIKNENWSPSSVGRMTITNTIVSDNTAHSDGANAFGGGIYNDGTMTLTDSTVTRNSATTITGNASTGGIHNIKNSDLLGAGSMTLTNCTVSANTAKNNGGINNTSGQLTLLNSMVVENQSTTGDAGGIFNNRGSVILTNSSLSDNTTTHRGGGMYSYGGTIIIENSTVSNNHSDDVGGGIQTAVEATLEIRNSTISGNSATNRGGSLESFGGLVTITNSTLSGNSANQGGGIYNYAPLNLNHVTFSGNSAVEGANLYIVHDSIRSATQMTNTLIANALTSSNCAGNPLFITDNGYNLADDGTCNLTNPTSKPNTAALINPTLANNGGYTDTHALLDGSPCIDAIPCGTNGCGGSILTDQRGISRPQGNGCDIGAFELVCETDTEPPVAREAQANPNPAKTNTIITLTAKIDDSTTGGSTIASAKYRVDDGSWMPMRAEDGVFDTSVETVRNCSKIN